MSALHSLALQTPGVRTVILNDFYRINSQPNIEYGCVGIQQAQHEVLADSSTIRYGFQMVYADRLTTDRSNEVDIHSDGILILGNIINALHQLTNADVYSNITYDTTVQRFIDECAVVVATFSIETAFDLGNCFEAGREGFTYQFDLELK